MSTTSPSEFIDSECVYVCCLYSADSDDSENSPVLCKMLQSCCENDRACQACHQMKWPNYAFNLHTNTFKRSAEKTHHSHRALQFWLDHSSGAQNVLLSKWNGMEWEMARSGWRSRPLQFADRTNLIRWKWWAGQHKRRHSWAHYRIRRLPRSLNSVQLKQKHE